MNGLALPFSSSFSLIYNKNVRYPSADTAVGQDALLREKANKQANNLFVIPTTNLDHTAPLLFTQSISNHFCGHGFIERGFCSLSPAVSDNQWLGRRYSVSS